MSLSANVKQHCTTSGTKVLQEGAWREAGMRPSASMNRHQAISKPAMPIAKGSSRV